MEEWLAAAPKRLAPPLHVDYDRYAHAESLLGWCNARVRLVGVEEFGPGEVMHRFLEGVAHLSVAHVKLVSVDPLGGRAALVRRGSSPAVDTVVLPDLVRDTRWIVNARVDVPPVRYHSLC